MSWGSHEVLIGDESLSPAALERRFSIKYSPLLEFESEADREKISRKILKYRVKGYLDQSQVWLGVYFQKELREATLPKVEIRWIDEAVGWGLFAAENLPSMHYIGEYAGIVRKKRWKDSKNAYCFQYAIVEGESTRLTIDAKAQGGIVRFMNHSETPNVTSALATLDNLSHIVLYTNRSIKKGEQLCYSYGPDYWKKRSQPRKL